MNVAVARDGVIDDGALNARRVRELVGLLRARTLNKNKPVKELSRTDVRVLADAAYRGLELEESFDRRWLAQMRALARWRDGAASRSLDQRFIKFPEQEDLVVFLLEQLEAAELAVARAKEPS